MAHVITSTQKGTGPGGEAESSFKWTPSHTLSGNEQMARVKKAEKLLDKVNDVLYGGTDAANVPEDQ